MTYFVSYAQIFKNDDTNKREVVRLQTYNLAIRFLTRKQIKGNYIVEELNKLKAYFESKEFCDVYFLSPYILNENQLVKDIMGLIVSSGETNSFIKITNEIYQEVKIIKAGRNYQTTTYIKVNTADEYLETYFANPNSLQEIDLEDKDEYNILIDNLTQGYQKGDVLLTILSFKLSLKHIENAEQIDGLIKTASEFAALHQDNREIDNLMASIYSHQCYQKKDKYQKIFEYYLKAASFEDSNAMYMVGLSYFLGTGVEKDTSKALEYWTKAASLDNDDALSGLGVYYLSIKDKASAKPYLEKSALKGDYKALLLLDTDFERK